MGGFMLSMYLQHKYNKNNKFIKSAAAKKKLLRAQEVARGTHKAH